MFEVGWHIVYQTWYRSLGWCWDIFSKWSQHHHSPFWGSCFHSAYCHNGQTHQSQDEDLICSLCWMAKSQCSERAMISEPLLRRWNNYGKEFEIPWQLHVVIVTLVWLERDVLDGWKGRLGERDDSAMLSILLRRSFNSSLIAMISELSHGWGSIWELGEGDLQNVDQRHCDWD